MRDIKGRADFKVQGSNAQPKLSVLNRTREEPARRGSEMVAPLVMFALGSEEMLEFQHP